MTDAQVRAALVRLGPAAVAPLREAARAHPRPGVRAGARAALAALGAAPDDGPAPLEAPGTGEPGPGVR